MAGSVSDFITLAIVLALIVFAIWNFVMLREIQSSVDELQDVLIISTQAPRPVS